VPFLDEFPEFGTRVLEAFSEPFEDKVVMIQRDASLTNLPDQFSTGNSTERSTKLNHKSPEKSSKPTLDTSSGKIIRMPGNTSTS